MSVDIGWEAITSGPDGVALAEKVRAFVHQKFQQIPLPRFINAVYVHSFEFGRTAPEIEIKDICDPLPDFYDDEDGDGAREHSTVPAPDSASGAMQPANYHHSNPAFPSSYQPSHGAQLSNILTGPDRSDGQIPTSTKEFLSTSANPLADPFPRSATPGIPGGTSNLSYLHFPGGGLSGTQTPLAAVASGTPFSPRRWSHNVAHSFMTPDHAAPSTPIQTRQLVREAAGHDDPSTRPSTANSISSPHESDSGLSSPRLPQSSYPENGGDGPAVEVMTPLSPLRLQSRNPSDLQVVARVKYSGDVRMTLTADILLDYPMPSFVGIPLRLAITGMTFDGVAIVAWIKRKVHFCFLDPEDASALVGDTDSVGPTGEKGSIDASRSTLLGLLREIHVESEIGRQEDGKQALKNVGKVEKFVLEQVRKIFEEEFVFPSYWTFLV
ncbi:uncharacterized protein Z518_05356 [Rhinocladiella mackenziei CBS 650.93]|uniref:Mitochondrial distribution and morphology protein 12 n=1 Tax=Rhinocladiella mackenziei CBS 650.93 TaxID=1442369 RepID=A0A0D2IMZ3_9EURO|nr:uncharacterized protein Z518_05356 [Rhinocladiella mackenziei CBS 650.93]KIX04486.1 hypothetical protein Z518_05356 [Rhinocladiella mackenziei CBS 650.93]